MSDYNFDHPDITPEHIQYLQNNPLEACQRENASLRMRLNSFNRMLLEVKEESERRLNRINQVSVERDYAFAEGEKYAKGEVESEMTVLRKEKWEMELKISESEDRQEEVQDNLRIAGKKVRDTQLVMTGTKKDVDAWKDSVAGVEYESARLLRENEKLKEELQEAQEMLRGKDLHIKYLEEETKSLSASMVATPEPESERVKVLEEQLRILAAERDDMSQQLDIVTENLMGTPPPPRELTPIDFSPRGSTPKNPELEERAQSEIKPQTPHTMSASADPTSPDFFARGKKKAYVPSPLRQASTPESIEDEGEEQQEEGVEQDEENEEEEMGYEGELEEELKQSIEKDENDISTKESRKYHENRSQRQRLFERIKKLEKRNMLLERYHDTTHVTRAILSLAPTHFEALRERKESRRKEQKTLFDVMNTERDALRKQNRCLEKKLQALVDSKSSDRHEPITGDHTLNEAQLSVYKDDAEKYKKLYEEAENVMKKMVETGADVDAQEVTELRRERDILKKKKEELEEEIDGPLGLREELAFSVAEETEHVPWPTQVKRLKAEIALRTRERDVILEESHVVENIEAITELMDQVSRNREIDVYPGEKKEEQYEELAQRHLKCLRDLSDKKEMIKTLEKFLEERYMEYRDIAGDEDDNSVKARLARTLIELHQVKRKLMDTMIQRNSLTKTAVNSLATALRENETLGQKIYALEQNPNRDPDGPATNMDIGNAEMIVRLEGEVSSLRERLDHANHDTESAERRAARLRERLDSYLEMSANAQNPHPRVEELRKYRDRTPIDPNATEGEIIEHLKNQLQSSDGVLDVLVARINVLVDEYGESNTERAEIAERRLEECMDLVDGPLGQKEAWDNLKGLLADARQELMLKMEEWKERDEERDWAVESLEKLLKESEEREGELAKLLHTTQEELKGEGVLAEQVVNLEEKIEELEVQLQASAERIIGLSTEKDENETKINGLKSSLRVNEARSKQLEDERNEIGERIRDLQQGNQDQKFEIERLEDFSRANETKTAEFFKILREEEEEQYHEEIERLHELLLLKEEEDDQSRQEIERLHEAQTISEAKISQLASSKEEEEERYRGEIGRLHGLEVANGMRIRELVDKELEITSHISDLEAEIERWKVVSREGIEELDTLHKKVEDLEDEIEIERLNRIDRRDKDVQTEAIAGEDGEIIESSIPSTKPRKSKKKTLKKVPKDTTYNPRHNFGSASESEPEDEDEDEDEEKEELKPKPESKPEREPTKSTKLPPEPKSKPKKIISIRRDITRVAVFPSPAPSLTVKFTNKEKEMAKAKSISPREFESESESTNTSPSKPPMARTKKTKKEKRGGRREEEKGKGDRRARTRREYDLAWKIGDEDHLDQLDRLEGREKEDAELESESAEGGEEIQREKLMAVGEGEEGGEEEEKGEIKGGKAERERDGELVAEDEDEDEPENKTENEKEKDENENEQDKEEEKKEEQEKPRSRSRRRTRNPNPIYKGELVVLGPGRGQKRKAEGNSSGGGGGRREKRGRR